MLDSSKSDSFFATSWDANFLGFKEHTSVKCLTSALSGHWTSLLLPWLLPPKKVHRKARTGKDCHLRLCPLNKRYRFVIKLMLVSQRKLFVEFDLKSKIFYDTKKSKQKIRDYSLTLDDAGKVKKSKKRMTSPKYEMLHQTVFKWYKQERATSIPVCGMEMQSAAEYLASQLGVSDFRASQIWFNWFCSCYCLIDKKICGEYLGADFDCSTFPWNSNFTHERQQTAFKPALYSDDETGLFCKAMLSYATRHAHLRKKISQETNVNTAMCQSRRQLPM